MNTTVFSRVISRMGMVLLRFTGGILALALVLGRIPLAYGQQGAQPGPNRTGPIPVSEFSRLVQSFSEEGGHFRSDTFTSNESSYLHVVGKLQDLVGSGGAYVGVAPEQNFTYIAKVRPSIAFIVDIRRQAIIQHLMYKAIFHLAENRAQFLSLLFSKPVPGPASKTGDPLIKLLNYIRDAPTTREAFLANLAIIRKTIETGFQFPLTTQDVQSLEYVYSAFWQGNLRIGSRFPTGQQGSGYGGMPNLANLILETDLNGKRGNFLAQEDDYQFVRKLQGQNRIIPVVGDFAGAKALPAVANYLRENGYTVSAFYTSNVEQFLFENDVFDKFAENVGKFPISDRSVLIRAFLGGEVFTLLRSQVIAR